MACIAWNLVDDHMHPVSEENVIGHLVKPAPLDLMVRFGELPDFILFWVFRYRLFMAFHTYLNLRNPREGPFSNILVARHTFQTLLLMGLMVKLNGLLHPSSRDRGEKRKNHHNGKDNSHQKEPAPSSFSHG